MRISPPNADGTVDLEHYSHHFHIAMTDASYQKRPDGTDDMTALQTPLLHCTDRGCTYTAQTVVPVLGDPQTQVVHAHYLLSKAGAASLDEAKNSITQRASAALTAARQDRLFPADGPKGMKPPSAL